MVEKKGNVRIIASKILDLSPKEAKRKAIEWAKEGVPLLIVHYVTGIARMTLRKIFRMNGVNERLSLRNYAVVNPEGKAVKATLLKGSGGRSRWTPMARRDSMGNRLGEAHLPTKEDLEKRKEWRGHKSKTYLFKEKERKSKEAVLYKLDDDDSRMNEGKNYTGYIKEIKEKKKSEAELREEAMKLVEEEVNGKGREYNYAQR